MAVDDELRDHLDTQGHGTAGTDLFSGKMPAGVVNATVVTMYQGSPPEHTCGSDGFTLERPRVQVNVRNTSEASCQTQAAGVALELSKIENQSIGGVYYRSVLVLQTPGLLERDENDRPIYSFNCAVEKVPS